MRLSLSVATLIVAFTMLFSGQEEPKAEAAPPVAEAPDYAGQISALQSELDAAKLALEALADRMDGFVSCDCPEPTKTETFTKPAEAPKPAPKSVRSVVVPRATYYQGNCANGQCGVRRGLFGRRR